MADLERVRMRVWYNLMNQSPFYSQAYARYRRAELLEATGRLGEAWHPMGLLRSAAIHERLGEVDAAADAHRRVLELWSGAEPEVAELLEDVGEGLRRAGGG